VNSVTCAIASHNKRRSYLPEGSDVLRGANAAGHTHLRWLHAPALRDSLCRAVALARAGRAWRFSSVPPSPCAHLLHLRPLQPSLDRTPPTCLFPAPPLHRTHAAALPRYAPPTTYLLAGCHTSRYAAFMPSGAPAAGSHFLGRGTILCRPDLSMPY